MSILRPGDEDPDSVVHVAHDFNNQLQVAVGNLELLRRHLTKPAAGGVSPETLLHAIEAALKAAREASDLGERLADMAKKGEASGR